MESGPLLYRNDLSSKMKFFEKNRIGQWTSQREEEDGGTLSEDSQPWKILSRLRTLLSIPVEMWKPTEGKNLIVIDHINHH